MVNCDDPCTPDQWPWECDCDGPDVGRIDDFEWPPVIVVIVGSLLLIAYVVYLLTMRGRHKKSTKRRPTTTLVRRSVTTRKCHKYNTLLPYFDDMYVANDMSMITVRKPCCLVYLTINTRMLFYGLVVVAGESSSATAWLWSSWVAGTCTTRSVRRRC